MAPQADVIADTILGLKRALQKDSDSFGTEVPLTKPTNRGNKLQNGAKYVHEGALAYIRDADSYKEKIEHAGYSKFILSRNPRRYNEYDEELDEFSSDEEADVVAAEENVYSGIKLEELLCPLKHPSELHTHPSLSHAYLSDALPRMVRATNDKRRQEQANLWRAKGLYRQILGDGAWVPCSAVETQEDANMSEPGEGGYQHASKKRKRDGSQQRKETIEGEGQPAQQPIITSGPDVRASKPEVEKKGSINDVDMADAGEDAEIAKDDGGTRERTYVPSNTALGGVEEAEAGQEDAEPNGVLESKTNAAEPQNDKIETPSNSAGQDEVLPQAGDGLPADQNSPQRSRSASPSVTPPPPPRRMTTRARALAAESNSASHSSDPTPPLSPTSTNTSLTVHPLFLAPDSARADRDFGLFPQEADETRRLLGLYTQKQEECVRGYERMLQMLMRAEKMRQDVLEWSKAEGHVGEMSDGEDWYDREFWGLEEEGLRKGHDEDDEAGAQGIEEVRGKKTRRRA